MGGLAEGVWESPALLQSGLRMAKGQALLAFPTGKCPPTEWYFPKATFGGAGGTGGHVWFR